MIFAGAFDTTPEMYDRYSRKFLEIKVNTDNFVAAITAAARMLSRLDVEMELHGLEPHQVDALMFVRGSSHEYATPGERDEYLRTLLSHERLGHVAAAAFLSGWFTFRCPDVEPSQLAWHRLIGDTAVQVSTTAADVLAALR